MFLRKFRDNWLSNLQFSLEFLPAPEEVGIMVFLRSEGPSGGGGGVLWILVFLREGAGFKGK